MPSISAYQESTWHTAGTSFTTANISWSAGDIIVVLEAVEGSTFGTPTLPTATGLTFNSIDLNTAANTCLSRSAYAIAGSSGGPVGVNFTITSSAQAGIGAWVISGATGIGDHKEQHTTGKTVSMTMQGSNSVSVWGLFDFNADLPSGATPTPTNTREVSTGNFGVLVCDLTPGTSTTYGMTGGGTTGPFSILAVEVASLVTAVVPDPRGYLRSKAALGA